MDFSKKGVEKKQKALVSKLPRNKRKLSVSLFKTLLVIFLAIVVLGIGSGFGMLKGILDDTPEVNAKDLIPKGYQTTLYDQDGKELMVLASFDANREYVYYDDIPETLVNSFIAIEDKRFWEHNGIDVQGIMRAFAHGLQSGDFDQGASTLTQQLIKTRSSMSVWMKKPCLTRSNVRFRSSIWQLRSKRCFRKRALPSIT